MRRFTALLNTAGDGVTTASNMAAGSLCKTRARRTCGRFTPAALSQPPRRLASQKRAGRERAAWKQADWESVSVPPRGIALPAATSPASLPATAANGVVGERTPGGWQRHRQIPPLATVAARWGRESGSPAHQTGRRSPPESPQDSTHCAHTAARPLRAVTRGAARATPRPAIPVECDGTHRPRRPNQMCHRGRAGSTQSRRQTPRRTQTAVRPVAGCGARRRHRSVSRPESAAGGRESTLPRRRRNRGSADSRVRAPVIATAGPDRGSCTWWSIPPALRTPDAVVQQSVGLLGRRVKLGLAAGIRRW